MAVPTTASTCTPRRRGRWEKPGSAYYALSAWRETPFFSERERAALEWTESVTRVGDTHRARRHVRVHLHAHFEEAELVALTFAIVIAINAWNRLAIAFRAPVGTYQPQTASV